MDYNAEKELKNIHEGLGNLISYTETLEHEKQLLQRKIDNLKHDKRERPAVNNSFHLTKTLTMVIGLFKAMDLFNAMEETIIKPLEGLREYISTHRKEMMEYIDRHPEFFRKEP